MGQRALAGLAGVVLVGAVLAVLILGGSDAVTGAKSATAPLVGGYENAAELGRLLFTNYVFPLEITAALLTIAVVGAVVMAKRPKDLEPIPEPASMTDQGDEPLTAPAEGDDH